MGPRVGWPLDRGLSMESLVRGIRDRRFQDMFLSWNIHATFLVAFVQNSSEKAPLEFHNGCGNFRQAAT